MQELNLVCFFYNLKSTATLQRVNRAVLFIISLPFQLKLEARLWLFLHHDRLHIV